jgi:hypothetical protein
MKLTLNTIKLILLLSAAYSVFLLGHKIFLEPSPSEYDQSLSKVVGVPTSNYPGVLTGIVSGFVSPVAGVSEFLLGLFHGNQLPNTSIGLLIFYPILLFSVYGEPQFHFGFLYDIGFIIGILLVLPLILAIGRDTSKSEGAEPSSTATGK